VDDFEAVDCAHAEFERRLRLVRTDQWGLPTPCTEWTVRDVVNHVVAGARVYVLLLDGCSRERANDELASDTLADDPLGAFNSSAAALGAALRKPGALDLPCAHPLGDMIGLNLLRGRPGDVAVHSWDLARAIGADEHLDPSLVDKALAVFVPNAERFLKLGIIAPPTGPTDDTVPSQVRLLRLAGREP
jgi:uncharacterized protein (TIGR03086 family)